MSTNAKLSLGKRVRSFRLTVGLSQEILADKAGVHRTYMGAVERGERNVSLINILRIAKALGVTAGELLQGVEL